MSFVAVSLACGGVAAFLAWRRRQITRATHGLAELRAMSVRRLEHRAPEPGDDELVALLAATAIDESDLARLGFRRLGDLIVARAGVPPRTALRVMVDADGTIAACMAVTPATRGEPFLTLESFLPDGMVLSRRARSRGTLARPAWLPIQSVDPLIGMEQMVARHRVFMKLGDAPRDYLRVESLAELARLHGRADTQYARWRRDQDPDALLEEDLRGILGKRYARHGRKWARRLGTLPTAVARALPPPPER